MRTPPTRRFDSHKTADEVAETARRPYDPTSRAADPATLRAPQRFEAVQNDTLRWLASLPEQVRPVELTRRYPRIANKIALLWRRVARCEEYLDELVVDRRGGRKGFPLAIAQELTALRRYYGVLHPSGNSVWEMEGKGR
jgi:hypothetical protein